MAVREAVVGDHGHDHGRVGKGLFLFGMFEKGRAASSVRMMMEMVVTRSSGGGNEWRGRRGSSDGDMLLVVKTVSVVDGHCLGSCRKKSCRSSSSNNS